MNYHLNKTLLISILFIFNIGYLSAHENSFHHKSCLKAKDYKGCLELYNSNSSAIKVLEREKEDWRTYGPLKVNLSMTISKGDNYILEAINKQDKPIFLAINCNEKMINTTAARLEWTKWFYPKSIFEKKLIKEFCSSYQP